MPPAAAAVLVRFEPFTLMPRAACGPEPLGSGLGGVRDLPHAVQCPYEADIPSTVSMGWGERHSGTGLLHAWVGQIVTLYA